ncbi:MAG: PAS domain S-box protein [Gammaproteobacteria bacterium]|nr:PAS domain S-box protein [Candidatus Competibacteraceae bacterium]MCP5421194.1 PAS domain S-box protein [Gammaproteobacteria bacterium]
MKKPIEIAALSPTEQESPRLVHELQVHQVELEMQNEDLARMRDQLEQSLERYVDLYDFAPVGYFTLTDDGIIREVNLTGAALLGQERERLIGRGFGLFVSKETLPAFRTFLNRVLVGTSKEFGEANLSLEKLPPRYLSLVGVGLKTEHERLCRVATLDITEHHRMEVALQASEARLQSILRVAPVGIGVVRDRIIQDANDALCRLTGYTREELVGRSARQLYLNDEDFDWVGLEKYRQIVERGIGTVEVRWRRQDGASIDIILSSAPLNAADLAQGVTFTVLDITERKQAEELLKLSEARYRAIVEGQTDLVYRCLPDGTLTFVNVAYCRYFGRAPEDLLGTNIAPLVLDTDRADTLAQVLSCDAGHPNNIQEHQVVRADGAHRWMQWHNQAVLDDDNALIEIQGIGRDITEQRAMELELHRLATTDLLTGLFNRRYLLAVLETEIERARRHGRPLALILFDLDHFKQINDTYGHDQGDRVLQAVVAQVRGRLRRSDVFARWGGEEFLILAPETTGSDAVALAETLRAALHERPRFDDELVTASFGVTAYQPEETLDQWLKRADEWMYASKRQGRDRVSGDKVGVP